jgi:tRNA G18 (ribose-2'-O)-methylase SpoU
MKKENFFAILHNIRSCYNVGSIFRIADAVSIDKLYLTGYTPSPDENQKIAKTALGAENSVKYEKVKNLKKLIEKLKREGFKIIALETTKDALSYFNFVPKFPLALIVGNEVRGIDKRTLKKCDLILKIPMAGKKESLNVAVAFAIVAYYIRVKTKFEKFFKTEKSSI